MDNTGNAVAPANDAGTVEPTTTDVPSAGTEEMASEPNVTSEKTQTTQEGEVVEDSKQEEQMLPKSRFDEVNTKKKELEAQLAEAQQKAQLFEELQKNPTLASGYLKNMPEEAANPALNKAINTLKEQGFMTADDVNAKVEEIMTKRATETHVMQELDRLQKEYTGDDGMPKFDVDQVSKWAEVHGTIYTAEGNPDVERMFKLANEASFTDAAAKSERSTTKSERGGQAVGQTVDAKAQDFESAKKDGNFQDYLKKHFGLPGRN